MDLRPEDKAWVQQTWDMLTDCKKHELLGVRKACDFINIDIIYSITRSMRQTPYRFWECKAALPGKILTSKPLKLVLDRRPFI